MKIVALSDTHNQHNTIKKLPYGDVLVHCGDFTNYGTMEELDSFVQWYSKQPHPYKIIVWGNHEIPLFYDKNNYLFEDIIVLCNQSVTIEGVKFWGHPAMPPEYMDYDKVPWLFDSYQSSDYVMSQIPPDTNIVLTHSPPYGILDRNRLGYYIGNEELLVHLTDRIKPKICIFGHLHNPGLYINENGTFFYNVAMCDEGPNLVYPPTLITIN